MTDENFSAPRAHDRDFGTREGVEFGEAFGAVEFATGLAFEGVFAVDAVHPLNPPT
jgi:hypothetical protein